MGSREEDAISDGCDGGHALMVR